MAHTPDPEFDALRAQLEKARRAEVPDLVEVRACTDRLCRYLAPLVFEQMYPETEKPGKPLTLKVLDNPSPRPAASRGICSPIKTEEIRRFEALLREAFGAIESCSMSWAESSSIADVAGEAPHHT